jgi:VWFA-related protein
MATTGPTTVTTSPQDLVFRSEVRRVVVDVFATKDGRPVAGLDASDFELYDNGALQSDVALLRARDLPLSATLVLDTSASVRGNKLDQLRVAADTFLGKLDPKDEVSVLTFGSRFRLRHPFTHDFDTAASSLSKVYGAGSTALLDSVFAALVYADDHVGRPLIVVFSDGVDTTSWLDTEDITAAARRTEAVVFAVHAESGAGLYLRRGTGGFSRYLVAPADRIGSRTLRGVVAMTAGRVLSLRSMETLSEAFGEILDEMRSRYLLVFEPEPGTKGWHELEVRVKRRKDVEVRAREGFFVP